MATTASKDRSSPMRPFELHTEPGTSGSGQTGRVRPLVIPQQQPNRTDSDDSDADPNWVNHVDRPAANIDIESSIDSDTQVVEKPISKKKQLDGTSAQTK